jgi:Holliday junction resolvase RusA-like endonuclease
MERALTMFAALGLAESDSLTVVTVPGAPWSKSRPRFGRGGRVYSKPEDTDAEKRTGWFLKSAVPNPYRSNVGMACIFYRPNLQRIDADNMLKHVCDAANGILWLDDSQCTAIMGVVELDRDNPRTVVVIGEHISTLRRGDANAVACQVCGTLIPLTKYMAGHIPKTCSRDCSMKARGYESLESPVPCEQCGNDFRKITRTTRFCSQQCRIDWMTARRKGLARPFSRCLDCDKELAHWRGGRCRDCWRAEVARIKALTTRETQAQTPSDGPRTTKPSPEHIGAPPATQDTPGGDAA